MFVMIDKSPVWFFYIVEIIIKILYYWPGRSEWIRGDVAGVLIFMKD